MSPGGDRTPESGASFRDGGTANTAAGAGERKASWGLFYFTRADLFESDLKKTEYLNIFCGCGLLGGGDDSQPPGCRSRAQRYA